MSRMDLCSSSRYAGFWVLAQPTYALFLSQFVQKVYQIVYV